MGDIKNAIKKLHTATKLVKFDFGTNLKELSTGAPTHYLSLYHHLFLNYSPTLANEILTKHQLELLNKSDKAFIEGVYKLLRDMFDYVPKLTQTQFFMTSYAQVKATMACDIINLIQKKVKSLQPNLHVTTTISSDLKPIQSITNTNLTKTNQPQRTPSLIKKNSIKTKTTIQNHLVSKSTSAIEHIQPDVSNNDTTSTNSLNQDSNQTFKIQSLESTIVDLNSKLQFVESKLENLIKQNEMLIQKTSTPPPTSNDLIQMSKTDFDSLMSRLTILETELLIRKNSKMSIGQSMRVDDQNETTFHSFLDATTTDNLNSSVIVNCNTKDYTSNTITTNESISPLKTKNGFICQGVPVEFDKLNDLSLNSNDSTPTINSNKYDSKLMSKFDHLTETNVNILKAKDAVLRASLFCNDLIKINQQSKA